MMTEHSSKRLQKCISHIKNIIHNVFHLKIIIQNTYIFNIIFWTVSVSLHRGNDEITVNLNDSNAWRVFTA